MTIQNKYLNDQLSRNYEKKTFYKQKVNPNYQYANVTYTHPPESSYRVNTNPVSFNNISDQPFIHQNNNEVETVTRSFPKVSRVINSKSVNTNYEDIEEKKNQNFKTSLQSSEKKSDEQEGSDPNVIKFSNNNGPETFTITHKT